MTTPTFPSGIHDFGDDVADLVDYSTAAMENEKRAEIIALEETVRSTALLGYFSNTETLSAAKTLTDADLPIQYIDPGGADRDVILPAEDEVNHVFVIANMADADEALTVKDDGGTTIGTVGQDERKLLLSDGTTWIMLSAGCSDGHLSYNTETLSSDKTLIDSDAPVQFLDPGGAARDVTLPAEASTNHMFIISNRADAAETLTVYDDGASEIDTVAQGETKAFFSDGTNWAALSGSGTSVREILTADRTYYVRTDGNDSNDGLSNTSGGAFLTIQAAIDAVALLDINAKNIIIRIGTGTYTGAVTLKNVTGFASAGNLIIRGDTTTPTNVVLSTTGNCISATNLNVTWRVEGIKLISSSGNALSIVNSTVQYKLIDFGACGLFHVYVTQNGVAQATGNYAITGGAIYHWYGETTATVVCQGRTITLTGTPSFTVFAVSILLSALLVNGCTFSGSVAGTRYLVATNSVINTNGGGLTYLPGNAAGSTATGGQYV